jgi:hypothetical protein
LQQEQEEEPAADTPVHIRIPGWATKATVDGSPAKNGTLHATTAKAGSKSTFKVEFAPEIRVETGWGSHGLSVEGAESVEDGFAHFTGALLAGGDLHSGNYTYDDAVSYCKKNADCAAFTIKGNASDAKAGASTLLPTYFKEVVARNADPTWQTYVKADGPATKPTNAATVLRGALVYSLQLAEDFSVVKEWEPYLNKDYDITTTSTWNYALAALDLKNPASTLVSALLGAHRRACCSLVCGRRSSRPKRGLSCLARPLLSLLSVCRVVTLRRSSSVRVHRARFPSTSPAIHRSFTRRSR